MVCLFIRNGIRLCFLLIAYIKSTLFSCMPCQVPQPHLQQRPVEPATQQPAPQQPASEVPPIADTAADAQVPVTTTMTRTAAEEHGGPGTNDTCIKCGKMKPDLGGDSAKPESCQCPRCAICFELLGNGNEEELVTLPCYHVSLLAPALQLGFRPYPVAVQLSKHGDSSLRCIAACWPL